MKEEFNLSEKIEEIFKENSGCWFHKQVRKNIKEFIKKIRLMFAEEYCFSNEVFITFNDNIDKLAGEDLKWLKEICHKRENLLNTL